MLFFLDRGVRIVVEEIKKIETFPKEEKIREVDIVLNCKGTCSTS
jgi:hypothetical protein